MNTVHKGLRSLRKEWGWYPFILIPIIGTIAFNFYPLLLTIVQSIQNNRGIFIGLSNYEILFTDKEFSVSVNNTVYMGVLGVALNIPIAFVFANMLNRVKFGKNFYKIMFLLPLIISIVAVALIFKFIFSADGAGVVNYLLGLLGIAPQKWFASTDQARETVVIMALWKGIGYNVILLFAGLQSVPTEYYEAASIDGANEYHKIRFITLPCLRNTLIFVYITSSIAALKRFADVYAISSEYGSPGTSLFTVILYIYRKSFSTLFYKDNGLGSAASVILFVIILAITVINLRITNENDKSIQRNKRRSR